METDKLILQIAKRKGALDSDAIEKFNCEALDKINSLWVEYSEGKFGYSVQKQIYLETGNKLGEFTEETYKHFGDRIKWRIFGYWKYYDDLTFTKEAPLGHLPTPGIISSKKKILRTSEQWMILSRVDSCSL